uniref:Protein kinase domain-containing protein n=1 Tax=Setaria italica TaxID=4555 RepID=K3ZLZ7_SETIT
FAELDDRDNECAALERIIIDASAEPIMLLYACLKDITNNFSVEIGRGGFGVVYMGVLRNGNVAVKILSKTDEFSEKQFEDELICLIRVHYGRQNFCLGHSAKA